MGRGTVVIAVAIAVFAAGHVGAAGAADPTPPPETTTPAPDPAPPLPKPKPAAPKPAPRSVHVYQAPVHPTPTLRVAPTYTPRVVHRAPAPKKVVHHTRVHQARHTQVKQAPVAPKVAPTVHEQVRRASVVHVAVVSAATPAVDASDAARRSVVIAGFALAALLFLLVLTLPSSGMRFTPPGRVLMDHQTHLVLAGAGVLLLTALLFAVTGNG